MNEPSDLNLLLGFADQRSEAAFGELVQRYVNLVHSAALRLVLNPHLADDVSQAVFVALAQQAHSVARKLASGVPLSGWLHLTTRNLSAKTVRTESRRRAREQAAAKDMASNTSESSWEELAPHLDHALAEMGESDRHALLLRFFERNTARQIGQRLGLSEEAAQKRVARALDRLRARLALRGVRVSAAVMATLIGSHAVQAAPAALAGGITAAAVGSSGIALASAGLGWAAKITSTVAMTKAQIGIVTGLVFAGAIQLTVQQRALSELQAELRNASSAAAPARSQIASPASIPDQEAGEIARLQREIASLRNQLGARQAPSKPPIASVPAGPILLAPGRVVALSDLVFAGAATPEAALQSYFTLQREGQLEGALSLRLDPPHEEDQRMLVLEEARERMAAAMKAEVEAIQTLEILEQQPISKHRTQLAVREIRSDRVVTNTMSLGRTSQGWKFTL